MSNEYEIPLVLRVRAKDESRAVHAAEGFIAAARRFNGADLSFADGAAADSAAGANGHAPVAAAS